MRVVVLDDYGSVFKATGAYKKLQLAGHDVQCEPFALRGEALVKTCTGSEALLITQQRTPLTRDDLFGLRDLKWILNTGRNISHIDKQACDDRGVQIIMEGAGSPNNVAELAFALILAASKKLVENHASLQAGQWQGPLGIVLAGKTLGVYGLGRSGSIVAATGAALGMRILVHGRPDGTSSKLARERGYAIGETKAQLFQESDVLSIHLKATAETEGSITRADLAMMKPTAILVNTSRAGLIEKGALEASLQNGRPGYAALDVYNVEPLPDDDPLLLLSNVLLTPHIGYVNQDSMGKIYDPVVDAFLQVTAGSSTR